MPKTTRYNFVNILAESELFQKASVLIKIKLFITAFIGYLFIVVPWIIILYIVTFFMRFFNNINILYDLAEVYYRTFNNKNKAIDLLEKILVLDKNDYEANMFLSVIYYENYEYDKALNYYETLVDINRDNKKVFEIVNWILQNTEENRIKNHCNHILQKIRNRAGKN